MPPRDQSSYYRRNIPAIPEEELQTMRMIGLHRLTDIDQPDLQHNQHLRITCDRFLSPSRGHKLRDIYAGWFRILIKVLLLSLNV